MNFKLWLLLISSALPLQLTASLCGPCDFITTATDTRVINTVTNAVFSSQGCLAVTNTAAPDSVLLYSVDAATCTLTLRSTITEGIDVPQSLAFSPDGSCLAVGNFGIGTVTLYSINPDCTAELSPTDTIVLDFSLPDSFQALAFSSQRCLAVANGTGPTNRVSIYSIDAACMATPVAPITFAGGTSSSVAFSPDGNCLAVGVIAAPSFVNLYAMNPDDCSPSSLLDTIETNIFDPILAFSLNCLAVRTGDDNDSVSLYPIGPDCTVAGIETSISLATGISSLAFSVNNCLAVASGSDVAIFAINNCQFEPDPVQTIPVEGEGVRSVAFSADGSCLATVSFGETEAEGNLALYQTTVPLPPEITVTASCNTITVMGTTRANASVAIFVNGVLAATVAADGSGAFATALAVAPGTYTITAQATTDLTCISDISDGVSVDVPVGPVITQAMSTCLGTVNIIGSAAPGASITILVDGVPAATGIAFPFEDFGRFTIANVPVSTGFHCLTAVDNAGGCIGAPVCLNVTPTSCILIIPNLAFGTHCNRQLPIA